MTIPALALLAILIPATGRIGVVPALIALALYALLPIVRNTHAGLVQISRGVIQAAQSLGLRAETLLRKIELPLSTTTIMAGIKTSAVINVGMATIAAFIGAGGYGERIVTGLALNDNEMLLAGAIPAAVLALLKARSASGNATRCRRGGAAGSESSGAPAGDTYRVCALCHKSVESLPTCTITSWVWNAQSPTPTELD